ncbi:hypothetical protein [Priestia koreensis]|uniref:hypothetical protein n=2 Tax=Priestia koreensis TaxID=284581 RepID=UPI002040C152|nr:hypothetical protein [Priestia koreensis]MCM3003626.1 hypothetical protein [Priestia koreensis]
MMSNHKSRDKKSILFRSYLILMLLVYGTYAWIEVSKGKWYETAWTSSISAEKSFDHLNRLSTWTTKVDGFFILLFLVTMVVSVYRFNRTIMARFMKTNLFLFFGTAFTGGVLFVITPLPIGNLLQPLFLPVVMTGGLFAYVKWKEMRGAR